MDGIIIVNKPQNYTSHDIVQKVKKIFKEKVGHTGTLDPMATGVLPLLIGKGTKCSKYLINHDKIYDVEITLGKRTDTQDVEGKVIEEKEVPKDVYEQEKVEKVLHSFLGKQTQIPPIYSAIKVNGKKLYEYARNNQEVEIKPRNIEIYAIKLLNIKEKQISFQVEVSKGTYIRSLCEDIAQKMGTIGYMSKLNRIKVGDFDIKDSLEIEQLEQNINQEEWLKQQIITIEELFKNRKAIKLSEKKLELFLNGVNLQENQLDDEYRIYQNERFIGIGTVQNGKLKREIIL